MKRILSLILALIICLSVAPVYAEDTDVYSAADEINNMVGVLKMLNIVDTKFTVSNDLL